MNTPLDPSADWNDCPPGTLTGYSQRLHRRRLLKLATATAGTVGCVALLGFGGWAAYLRRLETGYQYYGLTCADVRELIPTYRTGKLDSQRSVVLEKHIRRCPACAPFRSELRSDTA